MSQYRSPSNRSGRGYSRKKKAWYKVYKKRINDGLEYCRNCSHNSNHFLTFGHVIPASRGGKFSLENITILCIACNQKQKDDVWPHLQSLYEEEVNAPLDKRFGLRTRYRVVGPFDELPELLNLEDSCYC